MKPSIIEHDFSAEYTDPELGYCGWYNSFWGTGIRVKSQQFRENTIIARMRGKKNEIPELLLQNKVYLQEQFDNWWPQLEERIIGIIRKRRLDYPGELKIKEFSIGFKKELISKGGRWNFEITTEPFLVFEGRMDKLTCTKLSRLNVH
ncbi:MAG: hypothetical protein AAF546_07890 [Verrucomicrobiota bacterium]